MVHVEELADELVDRVLGLELDVHGEEEGRKEEDGAGEGDQLRRRQLAGLIFAAAGVRGTAGPFLLGKIQSRKL